MSKLESDLKNVPIFRSLSTADLTALANGLNRKTFSAGTTIFEQGESGDAFYIVISGKANVLMKPSNFIKVGDDVVLKDELTFAGHAVAKGTWCIVDKYDPSRDYPYTVRVRLPGYKGQRGRVLPEEIDLKEGSPEPQFVAALKPGDYFGEQSLLRGKPRNATIKAVEDLECGMIDNELFKSLKLGDKLSFAKRKAIQQFEQQSPSGDKNNTTGDTTKSTQDMEIISNAIRNNKNLNELIKLDETQIEALSSAAYKKKYEPGESVITQGELSAEEFYIIRDGEYQITVEKNTGDSKSQTGGSPAVTITSGSFGELALLYQAPRAATVTCIKKGTLFVINRFTFKNTLRQGNDEKVAGFKKVLNNIRLFDCLLSDEKEALANALVETHFIMGETIIREGEKGDAFYILAQGSITFTKKDPQSGQERVISYMDASRPEKGSFFGERSLLKKELRAATAKVTSENAVALALTKDRFEDLLGSLEMMIREKDGDKGTSQRKSRIQTHHVPRALNTIKHEELKTIALLGCGGFGAVTLEQHKSSGKTYALKRLSKGYICKTKMQQGTLREKEILALCDSEFIIKLYATFKDDQYLYFLLEPALGGELYATYHKHRFHGDVKKAKFYGASVVFCFEHLHQRNILYRDLKPENLLMDKNGWVKLTDMGLAKVVVSKTYTTCGTPDYFAPEVIQQTGMSKGVDWWTLGVLIHELMSGHAPFEANDPMETYQKIVRGVNRVRFTYKDSDCIDLVKNMLKHQPSERLPMRVGGTTNIKNHAWFQSPEKLDWKKLFDHECDVPYAPTVRSEVDASNFRAHESDLPPSIPYKDDGTGWDKDF